MMEEIEKLRELRLLIVDDEPDIVHLLEVMVRQAGFEQVQGVTDPRRIWEMIETFPPDLILLDLLMPYLDGFQILEQLRARERESYLPVIVITAQGDQRNRMRAFALGAQDFVTKPFDFNEVLIRIRNQLYARLLHKELRAQAQQLKAVLDAAEDGILFSDASGRVSFANRHFFELFGLSASEVVDAPLKQVHERMQELFYDPEHFMEWERCAQEDPTGPEADVIELRAPKRRLLRRISMPVRNADGEPIGKIVVYRDISKEAQAEAMEAEVARLRAELRRQYHFGQLIGQSASMREMFALIERALDSDITVLITGESGTGKELVARAIHFNGHRKEGPFVVVNCAAIPESLIESELFGHEKGAFTGATQRRVGKFEQANGGTLFLDEIGEMALSVQAKLLRVLQEREIQRVGGSSTVPVDVRVIVATNRDLQAAVRRGEFREDLFYRIAAFPIPVPPLRDRPEDIPLLAEHFLKKYAARFGVPVRRFAPAAMQALLDYHWPGNVRELENAVQRAILLEEGEAIQLESLPPEIQAASPQSVRPDVPEEEILPEEILPLEELERRAILHALQKSGGNRTQAAQWLGISRITLYRKLRRYTEPTPGEDRGVSK